MNHRRTIFVILFALLLLAIGCHEKTDENSASDPIATPGGLTSVDLGNIESLGESAPGPECKADSDSVVCSAEQGGRVDHFQSWYADEQDADGDHAQFELKGLWKGNHRFQLIRVELGHDFPDYLLWNVREGGWILVQPDHDSMSVGKDRNSILIRRFGGNNVVHWDYWNHLDGNMKRYSCTVPSGSLRTDSVLSWIGPGGTEVRLDPAELQSQPHLDCVEAVPILETVLPGYLEEPQIEGGEE
jgi:hypothetical protein